LLSRLLQISELRVQSLEQNQFIRQSCRRSISGLSGQFKPYLLRTDATEDLSSCGLTRASILFAKSSGRISGLVAFNHPRNLAHTDSSAVMPISPAAQKFHVLILCSLLDSSVTLSNSSVLGLMPGKRHIADANQNAAEPHAVISAAVWINDLICTPNH
jgi:hypothetical protein